MSRSFDFIKKCEKLVNKKINALRITLIEQGQKWVEAFHQQRIEKLKTLLYADKWTWERNVPPIIQQHISNYIVNAEKPNHPSVKGKSIHMILIFCRYHKLSECKWTFVPYFIKFVAINSSDQ
jgi:hypothetical protein